MEGPLDTDVAIETPEHIVFHYRIAGPARRAVAQLVDLFLCYGTLLALGAIVLFTAADSMQQASETTKAGLGLLLLAAFVAQWVYFVVWEGLRGRSPGKMALGLRVTTTTGRPIGWREATLRNLLRTVDILPVAYVVGLFSMAATKRFQRLGDVVAGTMVVVPENARAAAPLVVAPPATQAELDALPGHVALDAEERGAIELFLRRRHTLGRNRELELAAMIADGLGRRLGSSHPDPARFLALVYDRAVNAGREDAPTSRRPSLPPPSHRPPADGARGSR